MAVRKISNEALKNLEERAYAASRGFAGSIDTTCDTIESLYKQRAHEKKLKPDGTKFKDFVEYAAYTFPPGLGFSRAGGGTPIESLCEQILAHDPNRPAFVYLGGKSGRGKRGGQKGNRNAKKNEYDSNHIRLRQGNSASGMAERLERDFPAIWKRYKGGQILSITAAAIAAGIKDDPHTPWKESCRAWNRMTKAERRKFKKLIDQMGTDEIERVVY
jgi:hypothetical protein